jgi:hypothetical protein
MIHIIRTHATQQQMDEMLEALDTFIKLTDPTLRERVAQITRHLPE